MKPGIYDAVAQQGEDFSLPYVYSDGSPLAPVDNTGWLGEMVILTSKNGEELLKVVHTDDGAITFGGANGLTTVFLTEDQTGALPLGVYFYKIRTGATRLQTRLKGEFRVNPA